MRYAPAMNVDHEFRARYGPWAVVAGASEGIGRAFAHALAARGVDLILIARRVGPLEAEAHLLRRRHRVQVVAAPLDLGRPDLADAYARAVGGRDVGLLIYNACASTIAPFVETPLAEQLAVVDVNCRGLLVLTSITAPRLSARGQGGMVLMSSLSGFAGTALLASYAASKAFTTVLGETLWTELHPRGVDVLVCAAGATSTPTFEQRTPADKRAQVYPLAPEAVAEGALANLARGPLFIPGAVNRLAHGASRLFSRRAVTRFMSANTRKLYAAQPAGQLPASTPRQGGAARAAATTQDAGPREPTEEAP
jgi:short-subunit dehydrogenase